MIVKKPVVISTLLVLLFIFTIYSAGKQYKSQADLPSAEFVNPIKTQQTRRAAKAFQMRQKLLHEALNNYFEQALEKHLIVGAGVTIVAGDSVLFQGGFGKRNVHKPDLVNQQTVFRLGSLSKGFGGVLAGIEVDEGNLSWEDKLTDAYPGFRLKTKNYVESITLSKILSHTTGVPYHCYTNLVESGLSLGEIASRFEHVRPFTKPGQVYSYQNAMFAFSGSMMEAATGQTAQQLLQNKIFTPLNMKTASTDFQSMVQTGNYAFPHKNTWKGWKKEVVNKKYYNAVLAGGINASAQDMGKWMRFLLGYRPHIVSDDVLQAVFDPKIELPDSRKYYQRWKGHLRSYYAYGWRVHEFLDSKTGKQSTMIHHGGSVSDFRNEIAIFPEENLGICVLFNNQTSLARRVIPELHNLVKEIMSLPVNQMDLEQIADLETF